jgi:hypothetical protein
VLDELVKLLRMVMQHAHEPVAALPTFPSMCCPAGMDPQRESTLQTIRQRLREWKVQVCATDETYRQLVAMAARTPADHLQNLLLLAGDDNGDLVGGLEELSGLCICVRARVTWSGLCNPNQSVGVAHETSHASLLPHAARALP